MLTGLIQRSFTNEIRNGSVRGVKEMLEMFPTLDVNNVTESCPSKWTSLHHACDTHRIDIVEFLLSHPKIKVNQQSLIGETALLIMTRHYDSKGVDVLKLLLYCKDVDVALRDERQCTPFWVAVCGGNIDAVKWMIALRGDELNLSAKGSWYKPPHQPMIYASVFEMKLQYQLMAELIDDLAARPRHTRHEVRVELDIPEALSLDLFATVVYLCDDYLKIKNLPSPTPSTRFFSILMKLPMEIQMLLCHRTYGLSKDVIPAQDSNLAFRNVMKSFSVPYSF